MNGPADGTDGAIGNTIAQASTDTIYTVRAGDSLSKIAQYFYGDATRYPDIAARNNIGNNYVVTIGQRLVIPATASSTVQMPNSPGGSVPMAYGNEIIETVTTSAARSARFWEDWRFWAVAGGAVALIWYVNRDKRR